jgi:hypothetical protein
MPEDDILLPDDAYNSATCTLRSGSIRHPPTPAGRYNIVVIGPGPQGWLRRIANEIRRRSEDAGQHHSSLSNPG